MTYRGDLRPELGICHYGRQNKQERNGWLLASRPGRSEQQQLWQRALAAICNARNGAAMEKMSGVHLSCHL